MVFVKSQQDILICMMIYFLSREDLGIYIKDYTAQVLTGYCSLLLQLLTPALLLQPKHEKLKPLMDQLNRVKDLIVPEFGTLQAWEVRANAAVRSANGDSNSNDPSKSSQAYNGTPMPFLGEKKLLSLVLKSKEQM